MHEHEHADRPGAAVKDAVGAARSLVESWRGTASLPGGEAVVIRTGRSRSRRFAGPTGRRRSVWVGPCSTIPPGVPCSARKNAACWETRAACCMLWVTMTIVTCVRSSAIVSSIRRVDVGSSAEHGSSISRTFGLDGQRSGDAEPLLLPTGERGARACQAGP